MNARSQALHRETEYMPAGVQLTATPTAVPARVDGLVSSTDRIHPGLMGAVLGSYLALLGAIWILFVANIESGIAMAVNTAYFAMYFGVPLVMARTGLVRFRAPGFRQFLRGKFEIFDGRISGSAALAQMIVVPVALGLGLIAMGFIMTAV